MWRHWLPLADVKRTLDGMAAVKLNVFHWHCRESGLSHRKQTLSEAAGNGFDGEYYTQDQVREAIAYARDRGIRVIPEFDMPATPPPGSRVIRNCQRGAPRARPVWDRAPMGHFRSGHGPTREETYQFLDAFIGEMAALFPDEYFHIGRRSERQAVDSNPRIQEFMRAHGIKSNEELQAYFTRRVEAIVEKHGKKMIGWTRF